MIPERPKPSGFARLAWTVLAWNVVVVLWGAYVRASGSGAGCGSHWPRCNGRVIPRAPSAETLIELTHRATSGIALLLVAGMLVLAFRRYPRRHPVRLGAVLSAVLIITEALVGAGLVLLELVADNASLARAYWMALHLTNTFLLLGALSLTAWWASGGPPLRLRGQGAAGALMLTAVIATLLVAMMGAVTALGDTLFPKTSVGLDLPPAAHFLERLRVVHPVAAVATALYVLGIARVVPRLRPDPTTAGLMGWVTAAFVLQVFVGVWNVALLAPTWMQIVHLLVADAVWITLVLATASVLADRVSRGAGEGAEERSASPAAPREVVRAGGAG
ncbi:MAG TPA: COX15/CtaA family protein [Longimicrobium sp.]|nr:COX15/CtaA family protein [Longimicrobium sp.]